MITRNAYETLLYTLAERNAGITVSTLRLYLDSRTTAIVRGSVYFENGLELRVFEHIDLSDGEILDYGYTIYRGDEKIRWYDPQPHPENAALAATFPHHFHEAPDIKHNRQPAPGISFEAPNLPTLIADCLRLA
ncbi:MAG: hypothetical protein HUU38_24235 [Anaerolineales bacterium]|nr:hypothetical protein [Anaerolineales bacterium]